MSRSRLLPSGKTVTRFWNGGEFHFQVPARSGEDWVTLSRRDAAALARFAGYRTIRRRKAT